MCHKSKADWLIDWKISSCSKTLKYFFSEPKANMHEEGVWLPAFNESRTSVRFFLLLRAALPCCCHCCISNSDKIHIRKETKKKKKQLLSVPMAGSRSLGCHSVYCVIEISRLDGGKWKAACSNLKAWWLPPIRPVGLLHPTAACFYRVCRG